MNKQLGAIVKTFVITFAIAISIVACSSAEAMKTSSRPINGKDLIYIWSDLSVKKEIRANGLIMGNLYEVRQQYREQYVAVGRIGSRCIFKIWNLNEYGRARAEVSNRWSDGGIYKADTGWNFRPMRVIMPWILSKSKDCNAPPQ